VDFFLDRPQDDQATKVLSVPDKYTREYAALPCGHSMSAHDVARALLARWHMQLHQIKPYSSLEYLTPEEIAALPCGAQTLARIIHE